MGHFQRLIMYLQSVRVHNFSVTYNNPANDEEQNTNCYEYKRIRLFRTPHTSVGGASRKRALRSPFVSLLVVPRVT